MNRDQILFFLGPQKYNKLKEDEVEEFLNRRSINQDLADLTHRVLEIETFVAPKPIVVEHEFPNTLQETVETFGRKTVTELAREQFQRLEESERKAFIEHLRKRALTNTKRR